MNRNATALVPGKQAVPRRKALVLSRETVRTLNESFTSEMATQCQCATRCTCTTNLC